MKKDIEIRKVEGIAIAIMPKDETFWDVFLINTKATSLKNVMINSTGYGEINGEKRKSSTLRYFFEEVPSYSSIKVESILSELLDLANEYWISFKLDGYLYDKKYVFVAGSLNEMNFTTIPYHDGEKGVMIQ